MFLGLSWYKTCIIAKTWLELIESQKIVFSIIGILGNKGLSWFPHTFA